MMLHLNTCETLQNKFLKSIYLLAQNSPSPQTPPAAQVDPASAGGHSSDQIHSLLHFQAATFALGALI